jgi:hypothetical protein
VDISIFVKRILRIKPGQQNHGIGIRRDIIGKIDAKLVNRAERGIGD